MQDIANRLKRLQDRSEVAALQARRTPETVRLIAVSKTKPAAAIRSAYAAGQRDFGENYIQELIDKARELSDLDGLRWHFIGHVQSNKIKNLVPYIAYLHTVDRLELVKRLTGARTNREDPSSQPSPLPVLIQVNIGSENSKHGCSNEQLPQLADAIDASQALDLRGLMAIPPADGDPKPHFEHLARLRDANGGPSRLPELSMGMTGDFETAIAAGSTMIRVGSGIFGPRKSIPTVS